MHWVEGTQGSCEGIRRRWTDGTSVVDAAAGGKNEEAREAKNWWASVTIFRFGSDERRRKSIIRSIFF